VTRAVDRIVAATLYEGYILYPYRPSSVKNQVRWTFGGVHPKAYSEATGGAEPWRAQTECLVRVGDGASIDVMARFLHLTTRTVGELATPLSQLPAETPPYTAVPSLHIEGAVHRSWEEAIEHDLTAGRHRVDALIAEPHMLRAAVPGTTSTEPLRNSAGMIVGMLVRENRPIDVTVTVAATRVTDILARVTVTVANVTEVDGHCGRDASLPRALLSTHVILGVTGGRWLSLADPPPEAADAAAACTNTGLWPVVITEEHEDDTVLASPIILEDHPQLAPESPGDLFDATEIDEILSLRILTLTDDEKAEMRSADQRSRALLDRTEALGAEDFMRMHGTLREPRPTQGDPR